MILCAGECLIDMLPVTAQDGAAALQPAVGGAVMNTAVGLGRLGVPVEFLSGISTDAFGQQIKTHVTASNVSTKLAVLSDRPTTLAFVAVNNGVVSYEFYDENTAGRMINPQDIAAIPEDVSALFFGGISLISEPAADTYATLLKTHAAQHVVMMDPNIRPAFIADEHRYRARLAQMLSDTDIVKTSDEDLAWLFPEIPRIEDAIGALLNLGPKLVLFTEGAKGATAWNSQGQSLFVPAPKAKVVDTVGAGDTFNAGFLAALYDGQHLKKSKIASLSEAEIAKALAFAARCAAASVERSGAQPPWREEVQGG
ncbi:carbohydrate kinase [Cognatishimia sp. WU-CL00825]|uniref:carbohydrate kinase family protein n=1 Tax=Cognatishimia sp. WU-CL00825 TaxID=3127658 RepID=UPI0031086066